MSAAFDPAKDMDLFVSARIKQEDAARQQRTAVEVTSRLKRQPGLILADEVGMGKTFVALASAATIHFTDPERRPVVIMVPRALAEKWPRDAEVFKKNCLKGAWSHAFRFPDAPIESGTDFLKTLDDEDTKRNAVVFVTHGALHRSLSDGWIRLAILRKSLHGRHGTAEVRTAIGRFAGELLRMANAVDESAWDGLLSRDPSEWLGYLERNYPEAAELLEGDDPVPRHLWEALDGDIFTSELRGIYDCLLQIPKRESKHLSQRITDLRRELKGRIEGVWSLLKGRMKVRLPLLIFDEAHHLKNPGTQLVKSLFQGSSEDAVDIAQKNGAFYGVFEKMLMLTATPFQLGHHELLHVLELFQSVAWEKQNEGIDLETFRAAIKRLGIALDSAQSAALRLDQTWARLKAEDLLVDGQPAGMEGGWWDALQQGIDITSNARAAKEQAALTGAAMRAAESELKPWVLRHLRPREFAHERGQVARRRVLPGEGIRDASRIEQGLPVQGAALLPFLLSARTVALQPGKRAVFAEGLASSYEAFIHTHKNREHGSDHDDDAAEEIEADGRLQWYGDEIRRSLLVGQDGMIGQEHPKVDATADKALHLWKQGEKVVIFCHYIQTGLALRRAVSKRVRKEIHELAAHKMRGATEAEVDERLEAIGQVFLKENPTRKRFDELAAKLVREEGPTLGAKDIDSTVEVMRRFFRTPAFLARFFPLAADPTPVDVDAAFHAKDWEGESLWAILSRFVKFIEGREKDERDDYLQALDRIQTGTHKAAEASVDGEVAIGQGEPWLPNVRLVNGRTKMEARRALMLTFNTPFYPEILIASAVLAEGVDLHLNCRHIIHHDLCWNPSTIEQRTGRVDRIGAKVEKCGIPIDIFMPYVAGTQDEKMYRVVMDRERWFKVVMGEKLKSDATSVEAMAARIPLPEKLAQQLAFNLGLPTMVG